MVKWHSDRPKFDGDAICLFMNSTEATAQAVFAALIGTIVSATFLTQGFTWLIHILAALEVALAQWSEDKLPSTSEVKSVSA